MTKLPSHLAHQARGADARGKASKARGLLIPGVVLDVYKPGDPRLASFRSPLRLVAPGITCDVFCYDPEFTTILRDVPIMRHSAGLVDSHQWVPRPTTMDLIRGTFTLGNTGPVQVLPPSDPRDMDGDHVLIGFIGDNLGSPVILGQVDHPRATTVPTVLEPGYRSKTYVNGWSFGVSSSGNVDVSGVLANGGVVTPGPVPVAPPDPLAGNVNLAMGALAKVSIGLLTTPSPTQEPVVLGRTFLLQLTAALSEMQTAIALPPGPALTTLLASISSSLSAGKPFLSTKLEAD